jgi:uncharacterized membrane protein
MLVLLFGTLTAAGSIAGMPCSASLPVLDMVIKHALSLVTLLAVHVKQHKQTTRSSSCSVGSLVLRERFAQAACIGCVENSA